MDTLIEDFTAAQAAYENRQQVVEDTAHREWERDFGHCFPDLSTGIQEEVAAMHTSDSDEGVCICCVFDIDCCECHELSLLCSYNLHDKCSQVILCGDRGANCLVQTATVMRLILMMVGA